MKSTLGFTLPAQIPSCTPAATAACREEPDISSASARDLTAVLDKHLSCCYVLQKHSGRCAVDGCFFSATSTPSQLGLQLLFSSGALQHHAFSVVGTRSYCCTLPSSRPHLLDRRPGEERGRRIGIASVPASFPVVFSVSTAPGGCCCDPWTYRGRSPRLLLSPASVNLCLMQYSPVYRSPRTHDPLL